MIRFLKINECEYLKPETIKNIEIRETLVKDDEGNYTKTVYSFVFIADGKHGELYCNIYFDTVNEAHEYLDKIYKIYDLNNL